MSLAERRASGIPAFGDLPWGSHYAHFYRSEEELNETLVHYFRAGMARNERCLWITSQPERAASALWAALPGAGEAQRRGQLRVVERSAGYLPSQRRSQESVREAVEALESDALRSGFDGLRVGGDVRCHEGAADEPWHLVTAFEKHLGATLGGRRVMVLCSYCTGRVDGGGALDLVERHDASLHGAHGQCHVMRVDSPEVEQLHASLARVELFLAMVGHDLRSPLAAINAAASQLLRGAHGEPVYQPARRIASCAARMANMVGEIFDVTRIRAGGAMRIERAPQDMAELCHAALGELQPAWPGRSVRMRVHGDPRGLLDGQRMLRVIINLVGNALEHGSSNGPVDIEIDGDAAAWLRLAVHNEGVLPAELLPVLFEPFHGLAERRSGVGSRRSLGLGLYICERIVSAHGGRIAVEAAPARGTTFHVELPRQAVAEQERRMESMQAP